MKAMNSLKRESSRRATAASQPEITMARPARSRQASISSFRSSNESSCGLRKLRAWAFNDGRADLQLRPTQDLLQHEHNALTCRCHPFFREIAQLNQCLCHGRLPLLNSLRCQIRLEPFTRHWEVTLSLIWSPLPRKSARLSETLPVTRSDVKSRMLLGSSSDRGMRIRGR